MVSAAAPAASGGAPQVAGEPAQRKTLHLGHTNHAAWGRKTLAVIACKRTDSHGDHHEKDSEPLRLPSCGRRVVDEGGAQGAEGRLSKAHLRREQAARVLVSGCRSSPV